MTYEGIISNESGLRERADMNRRVKGKMSAIKGADFRGGGFGGGFGGGEGGGEPWQTGQLPRGTTYNECMNEVIASSPALLKEYCLKNT